MFQAIGSFVGGLFKKKDAGGTDAASIQANATIQAAQIEAASADQEAKNRIILAALILGGGAFLIVIYFYTRKKLS